MWGGPPGWAGTSSRWCCPAAPCRVAWRSPPSSARPCTPGEPAYAGRTYTLGVSIGLVPLDGGAYDVPTVLHAADMACYEAKRAGRNRVEVRWLRPGRPHESTTADGDVQA